jgi:hypothetical protein
MHWENGTIPVSPFGKFSGQILASKKNIAVSHIDYTGTCPLQEQERGQPFANHKTRMALRRKSQGGR